MADALQLSFAEAPPPLLRARAQKPHVVARDATISPNGMFRYRLSRRLAAPGLRPETLAFIMLNPSTADGVKDDATIRRCLGYALLWGYETLVIGNLYAYRSVSPVVLRREGFPVGEENDATLQHIAAEASTVILAWGSHAEEARAAHVVALLRAHHQGTGLFALGVNRSGTPVHPLRQPTNAPRRPWKDPGKTPSFFSRWERVIRKTGAL